MPKETVRDMAASARPSSKPPRLALRRAVLLLLALCFLAPIGFGVAHAQDFTLGQTDIPSPPGGRQFGTRVATLSNGNFVVVDPSFDAGATQEVGAVYLYNGQTLALISRLTGSKTLDRVGSDGVTVLSNGNFVVRSAGWDNGAVVDASAMTWVNGTTGVTGTVSAANSLVGSKQGDNLGNNGIVVLPSGNYVVRSQSWDNGAAVDAGAVTRGSGAAGVKGPVSVANSLVGSAADDKVGSGGIAELASGQYVVRSPEADIDGFWDPGAVTWSSRDRGITGTLTLPASVLGVEPLGGPLMTDAWDAPLQMLVVGRPADNLVTVVRRSIEVTISTQIESGSIAVEANPTTEAAASGLISSWPYGTELRFTATPDDGYAFKEWTGDLSGSTNPLDVMLAGPLSVGAKFMEATEYIYLPSVSR